MKILIVEDEPDLRNSIESFLKQQGYVVEASATYSEAINKIFIYDYDCLVLDINLPGGSGIKILEQVKLEKKEVSVIIISANNTLEDKIHGLQIGADDYLTKPFHLSELNARIQAVLRRNKLDGGTKIEINELLIQPDSKTVFVNGSRVSLTKKEYLLLEFFAINKNRVLSKESISEHLWGDYMDQSDSFDFIYSHLKNLRKKLIAAGCEDYVKTVYGTGYIYRVE